MQCLLKWEEKPTIQLFPTCIKSGRVGSECGRISVSVSVSVFKAILNRTFFSIEDTQK